MDKWENEKGKEGKNEFRIKRVFCFTPKQWGKKCSSN